MNFSSVKNYGGFLLLKYFDDKDTCGEFRSCFHDCESFPLCY